MPEPAAEGDGFALLKTLAEAGVVFVALTFVTGWSYLAAYYRTFGLNPIELDIPVPVVTTIALHMLYEAGWPLPLFGVLVVVLGIAARIFAPRRRWQSWWVTATLVTVLLCAAAAALFRGRRMANTDVLEESSNLPLVAFSIKTREKKPAVPDQPSCVDYEVFGSMDCKLLLHAKGTYYFFKPFPKGIAKTADKLDLYTLPETDVLGVHIQRGIDLSGIR
jgi:hypothetical protein